MRDIISWFETRDQLVVVCHGSEKIARFRGAISLINDTSEDPVRGVSTENHVEWKSEEE